MIDPSPEIAVQALGLLAERMSSLYEHPVPRPWIKDWRSRVARASVSAGFCLDSLQRHFREGTDPDGSPAFYRELERSNRAAIEGLFAGKTAKLWLGHQYVFIFLHLNVAGLPDGMKHCFVRTSAASPEMIAKAEKLTRPLNHK